nr:triple gene block protein 1 [Miscanthus virus M]
MEKVLRAIKNQGFQRTELDFSHPIVVHGVPGCGKTTLLRELNNDPNIVVVSNRTDCCKNLHGYSFHQERSTGKLNILDEYTEAEDIVGFDFLFGDPLQSKDQTKIRPAHFIKELSLRVPKEVCTLLSNLGFSIKSEVEGEVRYFDLFEDPGSGERVTPDKEIAEYASRQGINLKCSCEIQGLEFEEVIVYLQSTDISKFRPEFFISCTRAKKVLKFAMPGHFNGSE